MEAEARDRRTAGAADARGEICHLRRYRLQSTLYRICSFLRWLELLRQELVCVQGSTRSSARSAKR